jgi:hypothetical protein
MFVVYNFLRLVDQLQKACFGRISYSPTSLFEQTYVSQYAHCVHISLVRNTLIMSSRPLFQTPY